jgi:hypothetical protein
VQGGGGRRQNLGLADCRPYRHSVPPAAARDDPLRWSARIFDADRVQQDAGQASLVLRIAALAAFFAARSCLRERQWWSFFAHSPNNRAIFIPAGKKLPTRGASHIFFRKLEKNVWQKSPTVFILSA